MKKTYINPEMEIVRIEVKQPMMLVMSDQETTEQWSRELGDLDF